LKGNKPNELGPPEWANLEPQVKNKGGGLKGNKPNQLGPLEWANLEHWTVFEISSLNGAQLIRFITPQPPPPLIFFPVGEFSTTFGNGGIFIFAKLFLSDDGKSP
jgi:hypothetical protein